MSAKKIVIIIIIILDKMVEIIIRDSERLVPMISIVMRIMEFEAILDQKTIERKAAEMKNIIFFGAIKDRTTI